MPMRLLKIGSAALAAVAAVLFAVSIVVDFVGKGYHIAGNNGWSDTLEIPCDYTQEQLLEGVSASDERDGGLDQPDFGGGFLPVYRPGDL